MIINAAALDAAFKGFKSIYTDAYTATKVNWDQIAMTIPSSARDETYNWLGQFPQLREWLTGDRQVKDLEAFGFTITNKRFESTVNINRDDFSDDRLGIFKPMFAEMGTTAKRHPEELIFGLVKNGFASLCYDGQYFFDTDHPSKNAEGLVTYVSNYTAGTGLPWYLFDTTRAVRPIIWQQREDYEFQQVNRHDDYQVFMSDKYLYGIRARVNAGYGLWQLAHASKETLNADTFNSARQKMLKLRGDKGQILGITPNVLVVPPELEAQGRALLKSQITDGGASNPWVGSCELIVSAYVAG